MTEPKFSKLILCTLVNDNVEELIRTYRSILTQNCKVTWVIISPERNIHVAKLITQWKDANIVDLVLSDSGKGIYPAMNFAISVLPSESWIWFLNAGDEFSACDSYGNIRKQIETDPKPWYFGGFLLADTNQLIVRKFNAPEKFEIKNQLFSTVDRYADSLVNLYAWFLIMKLSLAKIATVLLACKECQLSMVIKADKLHRL